MNLSELINFYSSLKSSGEIEVNYLSEIGFLMIPRGVEVDYFP